MSKLHAHRPSFTATDDGMVWSHDEARQLLTYGLPGATVSMYRPRRLTIDQRLYDQDMAYSVTLKNWGAHDVVVVGSYSLPAPASRLLNDARKRVDDRMRVA